MTTSIPPGSIDDRSDVIITSPTNGQVLKYNGTNWVNADESAGSGDLVLISTATASNSSSIDIAGLDSTYYEYLLIVQDLVCQTDDTQVQLLVGTGAGPTYQTTNYSYAIQIYSHISSAVAGGLSQSAIGLVYPGGTAGLGNAANESYSGNIYIYNPSDTSAYTRINSFGSYSRADGNPSGYNINGVWHSTTAVTALRIKMSSGNISSGTFKLYGIKA